MGKAEAFLRPRARHTYRGGWTQSLEPSTTPSPEAHHPISVATLAQPSQLAWFMSEPLSRVPSGCWAPRRADPTCLWPVALEAGDRVMACPCPLPSPNCSLISSSGLLPEQSSRALHSHAAPPRVSAASVPMSETRMQNTRQLPNIKHMSPAVRERWPWHNCPSTQPPPVPDTPGSLGAEAAPHHTPQLRPAGPEAGPPQRLGLGPGEGPGLEPTSGSSGPQGQVPASGTGPSLENRSWPRGQVQAPEIGSQTRSVSQPASCTSGENQTLWWSQNNVSLKDACGLTLGTCECQLTWQGDMVDMTE